MLSHSSYPFVIKMPLVLFVRRGGLYLHNNKIAFRQLKQMIVYKPAVFTTSYFNVIFIFYRPQVGYSKGR